MDARRRGARVEDPAIIAFAERVVARLPPDQLLLDAAAGTLRKTFSALCEAFHIAADALLVDAKATPKRPWISTGIFRLIDERNAAASNFDQAIFLHLHRHGDR